MANSDFDDVWLVMPLFNEAEVVGKVITDAQKQFANIVAIDDGSLDNSAQVAQAAGAIVVRHPINLGQGAALQTGIDFALRQGAQWIVTFDADGQHQCDDAAAMVNVGRSEGIPIVLGSRFLDGRTQAGRLKRLVLRIAARFTSLTTKMTLTDAHNGLRAIHRDAATHINLQQSRMAHASEIISQLAATQLPYREFPVHVLYTEYSRKKGQSLLNAVNILVELIFK